MLKRLEHKLHKHIYFHYNIFEFNLDQNIIYAYTIKTYCKFDKQLLSKFKTKHICLHKTN